MIRTSPRKRKTETEKDGRNKRSTVVTATPDAVPSSSSCKVTPDDDGGISMEASFPMDGTVVNSDPKVMALVSSKPSLQTRPMHLECEWATAALARFHPQVVERNNELRRHNTTLLESTCGKSRTYCLTDTIISTMLSQNTTDANSKAAFCSLKQTFPNWDAVADCSDISKLQNAIRVAGLAKKRAERIQAMLQRVREERGSTSFDYLRDLSFSNEEIKTELSRFKGLGPKTISCVLLFGMGRTDEFPVDTHVLRIAQKVDWVPKRATRESAYEHLNAVVTPGVKLDLHCLLVTHGKHCHLCAANGRPQFPPPNGEKLECPLARMPAHLRTSMTLIKEEQEIRSSSETDVHVKSAVVVKKDLT